MKTGQNITSHIRTTRTQDKQGTENEGSTFQNITYSAISFRSECRNSARHSVLAPQHTPDSTASNTWLLLLPNATTFYRIKHQRLWLCSRALLKRRSCIHPRFMLSHPALTFCLVLSQRAFTPCFRLSQLEPHHVFMLPAQPPNVSKTTGSPSTQITIMPMANKVLKPIPHPYPMGSERARRTRTTAVVDVARARLAARTLIQLIPTAVVDDIIPRPTTPIAINNMNTV